MTETRNHAVTADIFDSKEGLATLRGRELEGRTALITGSTSGLGQATAMHFAMQGARVVFNGHSEASRKRWQSTRELLTTYVPDSHLLYVDADMTDPDARIRMTQDVRGAFGPIDILGLYVAGGIRKKTEEALRLNMAANYDLTQDAIEHGLLAKKTDLVFATSNASHDWDGHAVTTTPELQKYNQMYMPVASAKHAVEQALYDHLDEFEKNGIRLLVINAPMIQHTLPIEAANRLFSETFLLLVQEFGIITRFEVTSRTLALVSNPTYRSGALEIIDWQHTRNPYRLDTTAGFK